MAQRQEYLIGLDAGTTTIKAVAFTFDGEEVASAARSSSLMRPAEGLVEQDMEQVWQAAFEALLELAGRLGSKAARVRALGVTAQGDGTWLVGHDGQPVRPAITWLDGRSGELIRRWQQEGVSNQVFDITGTTLNTSLQNVQLAWLLAYEPWTLEKARAAVHCKDWLFFRLTGQLASDYTDMCHTYCDIHTYRYSDDILELMGLKAARHLLPELRPCWAYSYPLLPPVAERLGLPSGLPVAAGPIDLSASAVGIGAVNRGQACSILGTAGIHEVVLDRPVFEPRGIGYTFVHGAPNLWLRMISNMAWSLNLDWAINELFAAEREHARARGIAVFRVLEPQLQDLPIGSGGVLFHPYVDAGGERGPFVKPTAKAQFTGIHMGATRYHLLRAVYEGLCFAALDCFDHMPVEFGEIRVAGGGARSEFWMQMLADVTGHRVRTFVGSEAGALGAAMNAAVAAGLAGSLEEAVRRMVRPARGFEPDPDRVRRYREWFEVYRETYHHMWGVWDRRAQLVAQRGDSKN